VKERDAAMARSLSKFKRMSSTMKGMGSLLFEVLLDTC